MLRLTANNGWLYSVSCAATDFCVATDSYGEAVMYNGVSWTASSQAGPVGYPLYSLSCPSLTYCAAIDGDDSAVAPAN